MYKGLLVLMGFGLIGAWIAGLATVGAGSWMTWTDGALGLISIFMGSAITYGTTKAARASMIIAMSLALFGTWIAGLVSYSMLWLTWTTFGFACAYFVLGVVAAFVEPPAARRAVPPEQIPERPRRIA